MKHRNFKRVLALLLAATMAIGTFAGCTQSGGEESSGTKTESTAADESSAEASDTAEEAEPAIKATTVSFSKSGKYTTTVTSDKVDLSGINGENVEVSYITEEDAEDVDEKTEAASAADDQDVIKLKVEKVEKNANGGYDITFSDDKAGENTPSAYMITFKDSDNSALVAVDFPEITLTPDIKYVSSKADTTKVTLTIEGSEFEDGISKDDVSLSDAFSDMEIESLSASGKNLTVQLKGSPVRNAADVYQWGTVAVQSSGIKEGYADVPAAIDVQSSYAGIDPDTLQFKDGKITADLVVFGVADVNELTKDNIKIDGVTVEAVEKKDGETAAVIFTANGVKSVNDFVDLAGGKNIKLGDYETELPLTQADFIPVFDYVEDDGDNLRLTLKLYTLGGTFGDKLSEDMFSFGDDFEGARVESVTTDSETLATIIISLPANGQNSETLDLNGTLTLKAGTLVNRWGERTSKECSNTRDYSVESLGRDVSLNNETLLEIQKYTRGLNTVFGSILYYGQAAGSAYSFVMGILQATGVVESEHAQVMKKLDEISDKIDAVRLDIESLRDDITKTLAAVLQSRVDDYNKSLNDLDSTLNNVNNLYAHARNDLAKSDERYADIDWDAMTDEEAEEYNSALIDYILDGNENAKDKNFYKFTDKTDNTLTNQFYHVTNMIKDATDNNPIRIYDEACSLTYNFDTQSYNFRLAQRVYAETLLTKAVAALAVRYDVANDPDNANFKSIMEQYQSAMEQLKNLEPSGISASEVKAYQHYNNTYISDIMLAGMSTENANDVKKLLTDKGYTPIDVDLNKGTNGEKIYLGYKTTTDINEAIKNISVETGNLDTTQINNRKYNLCTFEGDDAFVKDKGNMNCGVTYKVASAGMSRDGYKKGKFQEKTVSAMKLFLYYTKESDSDGKAITEIYIDNNEAESVGNLNEGTDIIDSTSDIYLHFDSADKDSQSHKLVENDPEYYPFCYVLGKKVSYGYSVDLERYYCFDKDTTKKWDGAIRNKNTDWKDAQVQSFISRMHYSDIKDELASAGIKLHDGLLVTLSNERGSRKSATVTIGFYAEMKGNIILSGGNSVSKDKFLAKFYWGQNEKYKKAEDERAQEFTYFNVY